MLSLALEKCAELGIEDIMVTCKEENIGSAKTIENNCGELKEIIFIPEENRLEVAAILNEKSPLIANPADSEFFQRKYSF